MKVHFKAHTARQKKTPAAKHKSDVGAAAAAAGKASETGPAAAKKPKEIGGPSGPEPTRYGDWERKGICVDF